MENDNVTEEQDNIEKYIESKEQKNIEISNSEAKET